MAIAGQVWELLVHRTQTQRRASDGKRRTIGTYRVFHNGVAVPGVSGVSTENGGVGFKCGRGE
jgi:hypothetical protein